MLTAHRRIYGQGCLLCALGVTLGRTCTSTGALSALSTSIAPLSTCPLSRPRACTFRGALWRMNDLRLDLRLLMVTSTGTMSALSTSIAPLSTLCPLS